MAIHWYPGHMHKANKEMNEVLPKVDIIIEVLDARLPFSSANPAIAELCGNKPNLKIFNKSDLADLKTTQLWVNFYQQQGAETLSLGLDKSKSRIQVLNKIQALVPNKGAGTTKTILAMISGIPNVGKSTLINTLAERTIAKTCNEPAVTKAQQRIKLEDHITLLDTPGILWPKIDNENSGYRLATTGAIKSTAMSSDDVAFFAADYLIKHYPQQLQQHFQLNALPQTEIEFLELVGARRGCLRTGGHVDLDKVSNILLTELREGAIAKISFETPNMILAEQKIVDQIKATKAEKEAQRKQKNKRRRR